MEDCTKEDSENLTVYRSKWQLLTRLKCFQDGGTFGHNENMYPFVSSNETTHIIVFSYSTQDLGREKIVIWK